MRYFLITIIIVLFTVSCKEKQIVLTEVNQLINPEIKQKKEDPIIVYKTSYSEALRYKMLKDELAKS